MEWSREPPKVPGHYWISRDGYVNPVIVCIRHTMLEDYLVVSEGAFEYYIGHEDYREVWWMGPLLPVPEPPPDNSS